MVGWGRASFILFFFFFLFCLVFWGLMEWGKSCTESSDRIKSFCLLVYLIVPKGGLFHLGR